MICNNNVVRFVFTATGTWLFIFTCSEDILVHSLSMSLLIDALTRVVYSVDVWMWICMTKITHDAILHSHMSFYQCFSASFILTNHI